MSVQDHHHHHHHHHHHPHQHQHHHCTSIGNGVDPANHSEYTGVVVRSPTIIHKCQVLSDSWIPEAAKVMAHAFLDSPSYRYIYQDMMDEESRKEALEWIFLRYLHLIHRHCPTSLRGIILENEEGENEDKTNDPSQQGVGTLVVCFLWIPSPHQKVSLMELIGAGLWQLPFRHGFSTYQRMMNVMNAFEKEKHFFKERVKNDDNDGNTNHDHDHHASSFVILERMAVRKEYQGQGWGSRALRDVISETSNRPMRLTTQEDRNVQFYQRLGYQIVSESDHFVQEDKTFHYHNWYMVRQPDSTTTTTTTK